MTAFNTCKQFCIWFVHKLEANGVAAGEVCSFDYDMVLSEGVQRYSGLSASVA